MSGPMCPRKRESYWQGSTSVHSITRSRNVSTTSNSFPRMEIVPSAVLASQRVGWQNTPPIHQTCPRSEDLRGVEGARQFVASYRQAFPDLECTIEDQVAEGGARS